MNRSCVLFTFILVGPTASTVSKKDLSIVQSKAAIHNFPDVGVPQKKLSCADKLLLRHRLQTGTVHVYPVNLILSQSKLYWCIV